MITVKLLGGAKRSFPSDKLSIENSMMVSDLLVFLQGSVPKNMPAFDTRNILVAINGIDSSVLQGGDTLLKDGDVVSIIPVVHGGSKTRVSFCISNHNVELIRLGKTDDDPISLLDSLRTRFPDLIIQGVRLQYVLNVNHAKRVIGISLEARKTGTLLSNKIETDILMRFACTRQINDAINKVGLQKNQDSILILIGKKSLINKLSAVIYGMTKPITPFPNNANFIKKEFNITKKELDCVVLSKDPLEDLLVERSAVLLH
ncbi:MAG: MoaD/ThiS family protein [Thaumarchaeota archaeon]|nr:MoaD/ThiS family protein [Nitrososphaerota archaeon]